MTAFTFSTTAPETTTFGFAGPMQNQPRLNTSNNTQHNMSHILWEISKLHQDAQARAMANKYGLDIVSVSWDDTARAKFSSGGPNISDMTLVVNEQRMPVFRNPNYTDITWDVEMEK
ncbi:hypothetical protein BC936DRAFT_141436, partial [Jimgerdemannia flammicorona]